jgi:hypothetical protein
VESSATIHSVHGLNMLELVVRIFGLLLIAILLGSVIWAMNDADKRGKPAWLVGILVLFTWPIGLIIWLIFRPDKQVPK